MKLLGSLSVETGVLGYGSQVAEGFFTMCTGKNVKRTFAVDSMIEK